MEITADNLRRLMQPSTHSQHPKQLISLLLGYACYKILILLSFNNDVLNTDAWQQIQPGIYATLFTCWSISTAIVLLGLMALMSVKNLNSQQVRHVVAGSGIATFFASLMYVATLLTTHNPYMLVAWTIVFSITAATIRFFWIYYFLTRPITYILMTIPLGQLLASGVFYLAKHTGITFQIVILFVSILVVSLCTLFMQTRDQQSVTPSALTPTQQLGSSFKNPIIWGISVSAMGVGILWGSSGSVSNYQLWVAGAVLLCSAFLIFMNLRHTLIHSETMITIVFVVLGVSILLSVLFPSMERFFLATVWMAYAAMNLCSYLLVIDYRDRHIVYTAIASSTLLVGIGLELGIYLQTFNNGIDTVTIVAVILMLTIILIYSTARPRSVVPADNDTVARKEDISQTDLLTDAVQNKVQTFSATYNLTDAESETLYHLVRGLTIKRIATERSVSPNTIKTQISSIYQKCHVHSKQDLIALFSQIEPPETDFTKSG